MATAKTREQYVNAWGNHVKELVHPMLDSETPIEEWKELKERLLNIVEVAADNVFPDEAST